MTGMGRPKHGDWKGLGLGLLILAFLLAMAFAGRS